MSNLTPEVAAALVEATQGYKPDEAQAERLAKVARSVSAVLGITASESLFDTEPDQLQGTLIALADDESWLK